MLDRTLLATLIVFTLLAGFVILVGMVLAPFLPSIGWAVVIAVISLPLYRPLRRLLRGNDTVAAGVMTAIVTLTVCIPFLVVIGVIANEAALVYRMLDESSPERFSQILSHPFLLSLRARLEPYLGELPADIGAQIVPALKATAGVLASTTAKALKNVAGLFFQIFFMTVVIFFIYRDGERLNDWFWESIPVERERRDLIEETVKRVFQAVIFGIFLTCVVQGALGGLGFWVAGLPSPILFGGIMTLAAFIPVVGTALVWAPGGIWLILQGNLLAGIGLLVWGAVVVGSIDNLIRPLFISGRANLPILLVALGALGGFIAFGLIGVVFGPLLLALPYELLRQQTVTAGDRHEDA